MHIHYYMQYFPGGKAAGSMQPFTLSKFLAQRGHHVTVVASAYNLDTGLKEAPAELLEGGGRLRILRLQSLPGGRGTNTSRLKAYLFFMVIAGTYGIFLPSPDVVVGSIQPLFTGLAALSVARIKRIPFILEVRDLWPDALVVKKALSARQARPFFALADHLYASADRIVCITPGIKKELLKKGIAAAKVDVFPNGFDPELFSGMEDKRDMVRSRYGWGNDFVAIYTGSFTRVTAVDIIVRAAARLKERSGIRFELFGDGPTRPEVKRLKQELYARNVTFHDPVPKMEVPGLLAAADVALMSLFQTPLAHIYFENKFIDYMGAGKPILAAMGGEQAQIIRQLGSGRTVRANDHIGLANLVAQVADNPGSSIEMGKKGREFVERNLMLPDILARYAEMIEETAQGPVKTHPAFETGLEK
jgi:glycosyltransferase involved in cell wall biosynthesis